MRIACVLELADSMVEGGRDIATRQLVEHVRKMGVEVDMMSFTHGIDCRLPRVFRETPLLRAVTAIPLCGRKTLRSLDGDYDLIVLTSTSTASFYSATTPTILYCHGVLAHKWDRMEKNLLNRLFFNTISKAVMAWYEKRCADHCDAIIGVHDSTIGQIEQVLRSSRSRKYVLSNGVETSRFRPTQSGGRGVIFVGRASKSKGFDVLLEAAPFITAPVTAVVSEVRSSVKKQMCGSPVEILRNVPFEEMPSVYRGFSVFVLPSLDEEHPLAVLEAMSCGLPVVATEVAAAGMIGDGEGGFIIPAGDPEALADRVNILLRDEAMRKEMGERNRGLIEKEFSWDKISERFLEICMEVAGLE